MRHPEVFLLPVLMLTDYFLTVLAAVWREGPYSKHFATEHYELNPAFQTAIAKQRWFNPRHLARTAIVTGALAFLMERTEMPDEFATGTLGCLFVVFGMVLGRHVSNLFVIRRIARAASSGEVAGTVTMSHSLSLSVSMYQYFTAVIPLTIVAVFAPGPFTLGGLFGAWLMFPVHWKWMLQARRTATRPPGAT